MKGYLNVAQRTRALEGSVLTTHLIPSECTINPPAVAAATKYVETVRAIPTTRWAPPACAWRWPP
eukprot:314395-Pyramimonas_sp.AAC.1